MLAMCFSPPEQAHAADRLHQRGAGARAATPTPSTSAGIAGPGAALSPADIYRLTAPSVVFIDTPTGTGSGVLLDNGYIVTNAHVVWPYEEARVVFANGDEFMATPVANVDQLVDLALLGPIDVDAPRLALADGESLVVGDEVYLIGYPGETESFPQPAIARGLISRMRQWQSQEISYFQTDAAIAGGQSGGILVSAAGDVIGLSGFTFADGAFGLAASTADLAPLIERLAVGEDTDGLAPRQLLQRGARLRHTFTPAHQYDQRMFIILEEAGNEIEVQARSDADIFLTVTNVYGDVVAHSDAEEKGSEKGAFVIDAYGPYFLIVGPAAGPPDGKKVTVSASHRLQPFVDPDDNRTIAPGDAVMGQIDYPGDIDVFRTQLNLLKPVAITVDAVEIDPYLTVERASSVGASSSGSPSLTNDNSGGGIFGLNAQVKFNAAAVDYLVVVEDSFHYDVGGYQVRVEESR